MKIKLTYSHQTQGAVTLSKPVNISSLSKTAKVGSPGALTMNLIYFLFFLFYACVQKAAQHAISTEKSLAF